MVHQEIRGARASANNAIGDLRLIECALRSIADEGNPVDEETRQMALERAVTVLHQGIGAVEDAIDLLEDRHPIAQDAAVEPSSSPDNADGTTQQPV